MPVRLVKRGLLPNTALTALYWAWSASAMAYCTTRSCPEITLYSRRSAMSIGCITSWVSPDIMNIETR
ncbi:hypothetical protein PF010_g26903 [Phytophthora fragariae]|uniref:Uncharacterized protein n=1 Tax=Phytophthora fragariae TaxID=53985 RepID=A0A6A3GY43_9STRA|nr:hypothetical protein PF003_g26888 [Phytophthora fragariae]KAE8961762.1 hypothetical protein PF011_g29626 [Phytophthora fragariae]KAE9068843.1 hypothetical protein PF010_g26903 [Phytophthora fragariae]KAE9265333.1 hypothetical protein PF001_g30939 [Phytophthora fragariae]